MEGSKKCIKSLQTLLQTDSKHKNIDKANSMDEEESSSPSASLAAS